MRRIIGVGRSSERVWRKSIKYNGEAYREEGLRDTNNWNRAVVLGREHEGEEGLEDGANKQRDDGVCQMQRI